jgi:hypothetical protein
MPECGPHVFAGATTPGVGTAAVCGNYAWRRRDLDCIEAGAEHMRREGFARFMTDRLHMAGAQVFVPSAPDRGWKVAGDYSRYQSGLVRGINIEM